MVSTMKLSSSMEDYLETIALLRDTKAVVRVKDISSHMQVRTPSVTAALGVLAEKGLVEHERYGHVELTKKGTVIADKIKKRHTMLVSFLTDILNIDQKTAEKDACKMEHAISSSTAEHLTKFLEFVETCPDQERPDWLLHFDHFVATGKRKACNRKKEN